jgi:hypothetical protein
MSSTWTIENVGSDSWWDVPVWHKPRKYLETKRGKTQQNRDMLKAKRDEIQKQQAIHNFVPDCTPEF